MQYIYKASHLGSGSEGLSSRIFSKNIKKKWKMPSTAGIGNDINYKQLPWKEVEYSEKGDNRTIGK